ncbi:T6SS immunity protein Tdi1 domain-containing protein [Paenibacillus sp. FSL H8-0317]|uniref:T6SS immunity protein Tdi1 domain-containing protein n=1 Tax=unclassified Paenibacillus TaxID=185978 RepID=UPI0030D17199
MSDKPTAFQFFVLEEKASDTVIENYKGLIPTEITDIWSEYGFGSILNGYLKIINPDDFKGILVDLYVRHEDSIPLFTTSMGDLIVWEKGRYLNLLNYRKGTVNVIAAGFDFFLEDINDESFLEEELDWLPFTEAIEKYGEIKFDECFGYVPILGLGGYERIESLSKVKLIEHIYLITQFMGPIE